MAGARLMRAVAPSMSGEFVWPNGAFGAGDAATAGAGAYLG
jgi:hypothetical protein